MVLEAEMREIGIAPEKSKLHPEQFKVLEKAQDPKINVIVLCGGTGCGKTNLGCEVVKIWMAIWMAQDFANNLDVSYNYVYVWCSIKVVSKFPFLKSLKG